MPIERSVVIMKMKQAFAEGLSASSFIKEMQAEGLGYRRTTMLADWRTASEKEAKKGLLRYVGKNLMPTATVQAKSWQKMTTQYMYTLRIQARRTPTGEIESSFRNIGSDVPLTIGEIEAEMWYRIKKQSPPLLSLVTSITAWSAFEKVLE